MHEMTEMHGGAFDITSSIGGPTTVHIEIPVTKP